MFPCITTYCFPSTSGRKIVCISTPILHPVLRILHQFSLYSLDLSLGFNFYKIVVTPINELQLCRCILTYKTELKRNGSTFVLPWASKVNRSYLKFYLGFLALWGG